MKQSKILPILAIGAAVFLYINYQKNKSSYQAPPIEYGGENWAEKVRKIVTAAGGVAEVLFGPGGPFAKLNRNQVNQAITQGQSQGAAPYHSPGYIAGVI